MADDPATDPAAAVDVTGGLELRTTRATLDAKLKAFGKRVLARHPRVALVAWLVVILYWAGSLALAWVCWMVAIPELWRWAGWSLWMAVALFGSIVLAVIPVWGWMSAVGLTEIVLDASLGSESATIASARERVRDTEQDLLKRFEKDDEAGLLPLLRYSRAQLDAYYAMGLGQTRRAFVNAAIAMWLGFLLLIAGIALYIVPLDVLRLARPPADFNWLILSGAVIIEVVSALFLWVYRSTIGQLTFYYRLQMQSHTAILCYRIAMTMKEPAADEAKRAVIDKLLAATPEPERPAVAGAKGLRDLLPVAG
jgi:hypothetical protein